MIAFRRLLALSAAAGGAAFAGAAAAQPVQYPGPPPETNYEYAIPGQPGGIVYRTEPMVQPIEGHHRMQPPAAEWHDPRGPDYRTEAYYDDGRGDPRGTVDPRFDRESWLADCRERIRGVRGADERASIVGGLLGAVAGGIVGNRVYDSHRTAGTLIGAGVGGLAGLAIGAAVDAAGKRRRGDECAANLDRYMSGGYPGPAYGQPYGQGYGQPYPPVAYGYPPPYAPGFYGFAYMPVLVAVPQRQVIRETVTEEWVNVPAHARTVTRTRVIHQRAPQGDKRIKYTKN